VGICGSSQGGGAVGVSTLMSKLRLEYKVLCLKLLRSDVETFEESSPLKEEVVEYADKRRRNEEERWQEGERSKWALFARASFPASLKSGRVSGASRVSRPFYGGGRIISPVWVGMILGCAQ